MLFQDQAGFPAGAHWYRGNLHSHTVNSDGKLTPAESAALYRAHGYHFLCLSEHDRYTDYRGELDREDFIILPGLEASANLLAGYEDHSRVRTHHMHGILGTGEMQAGAPLKFSHGQFLQPSVYFETWDGAGTAQQLADFLRKHGCLVTYNHPVWSRIEPADILTLEGIWALEIYNYNTVNESGTGADTTYWDLILRSGRQIFAFASDDNHNEGQFDDSCGGWIQAAAPSLTHDSIINSLLAGSFYSSSGPEITGWGIKNDHAFVDCSACERVNFICGGYINAGGTMISPTRDGLKHAGFALSGSETYVRAECIDYQGKTAWTNAIFLKKA